ncbi:MAG: T9SS type A sorting domain-containing protein [Paludibacter sp.]
MKKLKLLIPALLITMWIGSQNMSYIYDLTGNRTDRVINLGQRAKQGQDNADSQTVKDVIAGHDIKIYPNPTKGQLAVEISGYSDQSFAEAGLYDVSGKLIKSQKIGSSIVTFDLGAKPLGIYLLHIKLNNELLTYKIIKE